jgi:ribosomal protein S27AE
MTALSAVTGGGYASRMLDVGGRVASFEQFESEGGSCPECGRSVELWTCSECGLSAWVIDCTEHRQLPAWLRRGRSDGTARKRVFCGECADVLPARALPA